MSLFPGFFLAAAAALAQPSAPVALQPLPELFTSADYPAAALARGAEGRTRFRLAVDAQGRVADCTIVENSGHVDLDNAACNVLRMRGRFSPARDRRGRVVAGEHVGAVLWRLARTPFAERVRDIEIGWEGAEARCVRSEDGTVRDRPAGEACARLTGPVGALARRAGPGWRSRMREHLLPAGASAAAPGPERLYEIEAELVIAPDGGVTSCQVVRLERKGPLAARLPDPQLCRGAQGPGARFEPAAGGETRRARLLFIVDLIAP